MTKYIKHLIPLILLLATLSSCNKEEKEKNALSESVRISAFALKPDSLVLENLDKVFFSIDLEKGLIYNADSLPKGTDISELKFKITTENAKEVEISNVDTTYSYLKKDNLANNLNFPVTIKVVSQSGMHEKTYQLKVNVHKLNPDQLFWGGVQYSSLPGKGKLSAQQTVKFCDLLYCFMTRDNKHMVATTTHPSHEWQVTDLALAFTPDWQTLHAGDDALYILDTENKLHTSTDGVNWADTGKSYANIVGCIGGELLTLTLDNGNYYHDKYPQPEGFTPQPITSNFPIEGYSNMLTYNSPWLTSPQGMIVGGRTADGRLTGAMWGYDGNTWAMLNNQLPPREGAAFFSFVTFYTDGNWVTSELPTWFIMGGLDQYDALRDIWYSNNYGITWQKNEKSLMMPGYITSRGYASVVVCDEPEDTSYSSWQSVDMLPIPAGYRKLPAYSDTDSRLVPYIYMFGGKYSQEHIFDQVWRGTINRLRFEPIP